MTLLYLLVFAAGVLVVYATVMSAVRTFVLPRAAAVALTRVPFVLLRDLFRLRMRWSRDYEARDAVMALYAPVGLLLLPALWLVLVLAGYTGMFWAIGVRPWRAAFSTSGSSAFTLGFARVHDLPSTALAFSEAALGIGLLALLITYLPSMYAAFSRREREVALLEVRAGSPPTAEAMLRRYYLIHGFDRLPEAFEEWEKWFADVEESHTSLAALPFFRSPRPERSWITAAGAVLDAAALRSSIIDAERVSSAELCVRAGYLALRHIADFFSIVYDPDPAPTDPISIRREEFDGLCDRLAAAGVPLKPDRDQAWRDFAGWRVNYDTVLLALATLTMAPTAPWSSDRSPPFRRVPVTPWGRRRRFRS